MTKAAFKPKTDSKRKNDEFTGSDMTGKGTKKLKMLTNGGGSVALNLDRKDGKSSSASKAKITKSRKPVATIGSNWQLLSQSIHKGKRSTGNVPSKSIVGTKPSPTCTGYDVSKETVNGKLVHEKKLEEPNETATSDPKEKRKKLITGNFMGPTAHLAIDCEMVGVGYDGKRSALAQVAVVNSQGNTVLLEYVIIKEKVTDYRTHVSGITRELLVGAKDFETVQKMVHDICHDKILVGHAINNDLKALMMSHPKTMIRDTAKYKPLRKYSNGRTPSLRLLAKKILNIQIQTGEHSPAEDAAATMQIFNLYKVEWEEYLRKGRGLKNQRLRRQQKARTASHVEQ